MARPLLRGAAVLVVFLIVVAAVFLPRLVADDRNARVADEVARNAGIPASVTPGPGGPR